MNNLAVSVTMDPGDVTISGIIGDTTPVNDITITADEIVLTGIGNGASGAGGNTTVTAATSITLNGADYWTTGTQDYDNGAGYAMVDLGGDGTFSAGGAGFTFRNVYLDSPGRTLILPAGISLSCYQFVFYRGTLDLNGTIATDNGGSGDFVVFGDQAGGAYDPDDPDRGASVIEFAYPDAATLDYYPGGGGYNAGTGLFDTDTNAIFSDLTGSTIEVGSGGTGNFYVNGTDMDAGAWTLDLQDNDDLVSNYLTVPPWGLPYAVAFNMTVGDSDASVGGTEPNNWVSAASPVGGEDNNNVNDGGGNTNWQFERPQIDTTANVIKTKYDSVIEVVFEDSSGNPIDLENDSNEISDAVSAAAGNSDAGSIWYNSAGGELKFAGTYTDEECTASTNGAGDISTFYIRTTNTTWNTDATGVSSGDANSTDRSNNTRNVIPDLTILKGVLVAANGKTMIKNYGKNGEPVFNSVIDRCRPVIVEVTAGKHAHSQPPTEAYDAHNFFHIKYSEPVNIGTEADYQIGAGTPADNDRSQTTFGAGEHGGHIDESVADTTVDVEGYFTYPGTFKVGSRHATNYPSTNSLYRDNTGGENPNGDHGITIFPVGWSYDPGSGTLWPGYMWDVSNPVGQTITRLSNANVTDADGNSVEPEASGYGKAALTITAGTLGGGFSDDPDGFDHDAPGFSSYDESTVPRTIEAVTLIDATTEKINAIEFYIQDNFTADDGGWDPLNDHPDGAVNHGVRDTTLAYPDAEEETPLTEHQALKFGEVGDPSLDGTNNTGIDTNVDNILFGTVAGVSDPYFGVTIDISGHNWTALSKMQVSYNQNDGLITDLAGNLLRTTSAVDALERIPPRINLTVAKVGDNRIFVVFSEEVFGEFSGNPEDRDSISASSFTIQNAGGLAVTGVTPVTTGELYENAYISAWLELNQTITVDMVLEGKLLAVADSIYDNIGNAMIETVEYPISVVGLNVIEPVWADDGVHTVQGTPGTALYDFDGTGKLMDRDITMQVSISEAASSANLERPVQLFYDVDPPENYVNTSLADGIWLPITQIGLGIDANLEARGLMPFTRQGRTRTFSIPADDQEIEEGSNLEFVLRLGDLYCARLTDPSDPLSLAPWVIPIRGVIEQRSGVTILNNVINPLNGEKTVITYETSKAGMSVVQIFTLDGSVVKVLQRGRQTAGKYSYSWDGTNAGGNAVARGIYFIRVVAPGIDEYRKVMVVK